MSRVHHLLLLPAMIACLATRAQNTAEDYFNLAARQYVKEDKPAALRTLDQGLRTHPEDQKLRALAEAILKNEQQNQQHQKQDQQQKQDQKNQEEQQKQQEEQAQQEEQRQQDQNRQQEQDADEDRKAQQPRPGEISQKDAERMLDALERREQDVQQQVRARMRPVRRVPVEKDW